LIFRKISYYCSNIKQKGLNNHKTMEKIFHGFVLESGIYVKNCFKIIDIPCS